MAVMADTTAPQPVARPTGRAGLATSVAILAPASTGESIFDVGRSSDAPAHVSAPGRDGGARDGR